ncbi:lactate utilization protein C [Rhodohalobacter sp. SW132]|uniref:LutC/YkgG family protein n=1 Tax=Rhodohalobacter sp. SW132 TaxID=2293433 RepID=UPI000E22F0B9|nr:LUD domain-containing protein [Rhodohalobacter sp. SW132]REL24629.1 lactate utilization protein C [Rhodohalobacter sp. SW132]
MSGSKKEILQRIRTSLGEKESRAELPAIQRDYNRKGTSDLKSITNQFALRVSDYKAVVEYVDKPSICRKVDEICSESGIKKLVIPPGLNPDWLDSLSPGIELLHDDPPLSKQDLNNSHGVLTGCRVAVAQTGTIILDSGAGQGRRALTLLPDYHICVVESEQITDIFPEAIAKLTDTVRSTGRPVTMISGPSATSDIELDRVEGVHGPRNLHVLIV